MLARGGVVAVPTDTVYGVAAAVSHPASVARLFALKERSTSKPVAVLVADGEQAGAVGVLEPGVRLLADSFWPGALTIVLARAPDFTVDLGGAGTTVGVRAPDHRRLCDLARAVGPLATTSANRAGEPTPPDAAGVALALAGTGIDFVIDEGQARGGVASTVVRLDDGEVVVLREGPVTAAQLRSALDARG